jgi:putative hemolysin
MSAGARGVADTRPGLCHQTARPTEDAVIGYGDAAAPWRTGGDAGDAGLLRELSPRLRRLARWVPGLGDLSRLYPAFAARPEPHAAARALAVLNIRAITDDLQAIPATGPLVVIANHPFGILDGLALSSALAARRSDVRTLATSMLGALSDFRDEMILVHIFGGKGTIPRNAIALRRAIRWVRAGGCLLVFPSGAVSHFNPWIGAVADPEWSMSIARLVRLTGAAVSPCAIEGRNSLTFQIAGLMHASLRTLLLARELVARRGTSVEVRVGPKIPARALDHDSNEHATRRLRASVYTLLGRRSSAPTPPSPREEAARLITTQALVRTRQFSVFWGTASQMPALLREIGAARERAFRAVGEGTGASIDLDRFDRHYIHLCLWDESEGRLAGAYRLGRVDPGTDPSACYTSTLFRFERPFMLALAPALELGRAFVAPEYQRKPAPLMLLWSGIARFVALHPSYRYLFGAVSLSAAYSDASRALVARFLARHAWQSTLGPLVTPREAFQPCPTPGAECLGAPETAADLDRAVQAIEPDGKGMPVLLRQYLKLGARAFGFSVDRAFGGVVDALVVVDLLALPSAVLGRYMGTEAAASFLAVHQETFEGPTDAGRLTA